MYPNSAGVIAKSDYLVDYTNVSDPNLVGVILWNSIEYPERRQKCSALAEDLKNIYKNGANSITDTARIGQWVLVEDNSNWGDFRISNGLHCLRKLGGLFGGAKNLYLAMRKLVDNRDFAGYEMTKSSCFNDSLSFHEHNGNVWNYSRLSPFIHNGVGARINFHVNTKLVADMNRLIHLSSAGHRKCFRLRPGDNDSVKICCSILESLASRQVWAATKPSQRVTFSLYKE